MVGGNRVVSVGTVVLGHGGRVVLDVGGNVPPGGDVVGGGKVVGPKRVVVVGQGPTPPPGSGQSWWMLVVVVGGRVVGTGD